MLWCAAVNHPFHFAAIVEVNVATGNLDPPGAALLYPAGTVARRPLLEMLGRTLKLLFIGYVPELAPFLPRVPP